MRAALSTCWQPSTAPSSTAKTPTCAPPRWTCEPDAGRRCLFCWATGFVVTSLHFCGVLRISHTTTEHFCASWHPGSPWRWTEQTCAGYRAPSPLSALLGANGSRHLSELLPRAGGTRRATPESSFAKATQQLLNARTLCLATASTVCKQRLRVLAKHPSRSRYFIQPVTRRPTPG